MIGNHVVPCYMLPLASSQLLLKTFTSYDVLSTLGHKNEAKYAHKTITSSGLVCKTARLKRRVVSFSHSLPRICEDRTIVANYYGCFSA